MRINSLSAFVAAALAAAVVSSTGCVDEPDADDDTTAAAVQELGSQHHAPDPLIRQDGPLGRFVYQQLAKGWFRWVAAIPDDVNPVEDQTGAFCANGQSGPVWYLAGTFEGHADRTCDVPFGKLVFLPLMNSFVAIPHELITATEDESYWDGVASDYILGSRAATCSLVLRVDGHDLLHDTAERDQKLWAQVLDAFPVFVAEHGIYGDFFTPGVRPLGYVGGQWALLALTPGSHTVELGGAQCDGGSPVFEQSATYHLHVH